MAVYEEVIAKNYIGLSSDTKPAGRPGEAFHEVNTGVTWVYDGEAWVEDLRMIYALNQALKD